MVILLSGMYLPTSLDKSSALLIATPLIAVMMSLAFRPAFSAGVPFITSFIRAPLSFFSNTTPNSALFSFMIPGRCIMKSGLKSKSCILIFSGITFLNSSISIAKSSPCTMVVSPFRMITIFFDFSFGGAGGAGGVGWAIAVMAISQVSAVANIILVIILNNFNVRNILYFKARAT